MKCVAILLASSCALATLLRADETGTRVIEVPSVLVRVIDQVDVPAREVGVLSQVHVRVGDQTEADAVLATIDDTEARLARERAQIDLELARDAAENDIRVRFATKLLEVAQAELKRANESVQKYRNSVSATELDQLRLAAEKAALEVEQAEHDRHAASLTLKSKQNELALAERNVARRQIVSPVTGVVVDVHRKAGEWVEPGEPVFRVLRTDRLQAEGMLSGDLADPALVGCMVTLTVLLPDGKQQQFAGKLVFVSPEIHPVSGQTRIAAEFENTTGRLRPGLKGSLTIVPGTARNSDEGSDKAEVRS